MILVTGVAGFIGYNFISYYLTKYPTNKIIGIDKLTYAAGNFKNLSQLAIQHKNYFTFIKGDITDKYFINSLFKKYNITSIINFAAETHVDRSIKNSSKFISTNITGTHILLDSCKKYWYKNKKWKDNVKFLQISTDEVYGSLETGKFSELSLIDPHNPYSASKAAADLIIKSYYQTYNMPILITRSSNNYGPFQISEKLIPLIIQNALLHKQLPVYGNGKQIRNWLYVDDNCEAIDLVFNTGTFGQIYNIGGNCEMQNINLIKLIIKLINKKTNDPHITNKLISHVTDRLGHDKRYALDCTKIKIELGWKPKMKFQDGLIKTINWYIINQNLKRDIYD